MEIELDGIAGNGNERREVVLRFRLTKSEKEIIAENAKKYRMSLSDYGRTTLTDNRTSSQLDRETLLLLHAELGKQGSNLNQLTRAVNIRLKTGEPLSGLILRIQEALCNIEQLTTEIIGLFKNGQFRKNKG